MTIGRWPEWNTVAARERAKELRRDIDEGIDPLSQKESAREAPRSGSGGSRRARRLAGRFRRDRRRHGFRGGGL